MSPYLVEMRSVYIDELCCVPWKNFIAIVGNNFFGAYERSRIKIQEPTYLNDSS